MNPNELDDVLVQINQIAIKYPIQKIVLFGSRARGDHSNVSDYDIAVYDNGLSEVDKACISVAMEDVETLKKIDILFINDTINDELIQNIRREGVTIYEQIGK